MIDAIGDAADLVIHLVALQQFAESAATGGQIAGKFFKFAAISLALL